jgi:hypothetical protein
VDEMYFRCSVRVVKSWRAGVGKTLFKKRMVDKSTKTAHVTIPLHEKTINVDSIMDIFLKEISLPQFHKPTLFHIDISHEVCIGIYNSVTMSSVHSFYQDLLDRGLLLTRKLLHQGEVKFLSRKYP